MQLSNTTAIVTGAGRNIGKAIARELACEGARVVCTARTLEQVEETVRLIEAEGGQALAVACDVSRREQVEAMAARATERFGAIDFLINNAGGYFKPGQLVDLDPQEWVWVYEANVFGTMYCCRSVLTGMMERRHGRIINMFGGGCFGPAANGGSSAYGSAKAAVCQFTEHLAVQLAGHNIQVNTMGPGFVPKEPQWAKFEAYEKEHGAPHPDSLRARRPTDAAKLALFFCLPETTFITGRHIDVSDDYRSLLETDPLEFANSERFKLRRIV